MSEFTQKLAFTRSDIMSLAYQIIDSDPDPVPRYLVMRDLLHCSPGDVDFQKTEQELSTSKWVKILASTQETNGTWGRFHTRDSRLKRRFPTTEIALRRSLALGLDKHSPILQKTCAFIEAHLEGKTAWPDPVEKHDDPRVFLHNIRSISAANLALVEKDHPLIEPFWGFWADLVDVAFAGGTYDPGTELSRHQALSGISSRRLSQFHTYYPLVILSAIRKRLPRELEDTMLAFLLHKPDGIYYVCSHSLDRLPLVQAREFFSWLNGQEVLARFEGWKAFAPVILNWLWSQRNDSGLWDMGEVIHNSYAFPLSESWRRIGNRMIDSSVKILCLLQRYFE